MIMKKIRILIVDDHQLIINGIRAMLEPIETFSIVGEANDGKEAILKAVELTPDVIIMDISMPELSGFESSQIILKKLPNTKILALTQHEESEYVMQMMNAGAFGYLLKNTRKEEFIEAIKTVSRGEKYFGKKISDLLLNNLIQSKQNNKEEDKAEVKLTKREKEIIQKIAEELSNQQIADKLNISLRTVETHRRNIMQKLDVNNAVSLIRYAVQNHLVSLD